MEFANAANLPAQRGVGHSPVKAVSAGTNRQGQDPTHCPLGTPAIVNPRRSVLRHAYDNRRLSPAVSYRGARTVDATTSGSSAMNTPYEIAARAHIY
jgi:hypothetical protein